MESRRLFASALRDTVAEGYGWARLRTDLLAGATVGLVALPLAMALAIASGVPPIHGLATCVVAGGLTALLGGSRFNVTGPTAAFVAVLVPIVAAHGIGGLVLATMLAGFLLVILGCARMGRLIQFIPYPVTAGFTVGIGTVIALLQFEDLLGLQGVERAAHLPERFVSILRHLPSWQGPDAVLGVITIVGILTWTRWAGGPLRRIPAPLVILSAVTALAAFLPSIWPGFEVQTIAGRYGDVPRGFPEFHLPWNLPGADGQPLHLSFGLLRDLAGPAFAIALLAAIESLLCAVVSDGMAGTRHNPNSELVGLGLGNLGAALFGGIAATGAIARTATNVRSNAASPLAAAFHAGFVLAALLLMAPWLGHLPLAALAGLLLIVAWNMADVPHVLHVLHSAGRGDRLVLITCWLLTVALDMTIAVGVGIVLASVLFIRRMVDMTGVHLVDEAAPDASAGERTPGIVHYRIAGPLFFGAAQKAMSALRRLPRDTRSLVLDLSAVPTMDFTGFVALETAVTQLEKMGVQVTIAGATPSIRAFLLRAGWQDKHPAAPLT
jgi:SulP family sulfate permease